MRFEFTRHVTIIASQGYKGIITVDVENNIVGMSRKSPIPFTFQKVTQPNTPIYFIALTENNAQNARKS
jgi:hypothetical protein